MVVLGGGLFLMSEVPLYHANAVAIPLLQNTEASGTLPTRV